MTGRASLGRASGGEPLQAGLLDRRSCIYILGDRGRAVGGEIALRAGASGGTAEALLLGSAKGVGCWRFEGCL